jgi:hypothetical protein
MGHAAGATRKVNKLDIASGFSKAVSLAGNIAGAAKKLKNFIKQAKYSKRARGAGSRWDNFWGTKKKASPSGSSQSNSIDVPKSEPSTKSRSIEAPSSSKSRSIEPPAWKAKRTLQT